MELLKPFADTGEKEEFDIDTSPSGNMSLEKGFTQLFELKPEEGGLFILRKKFNQLMYLMSKANVEFNTQSFPNWIADKGDGSPYAYNKGVIVTYTDNKQYVSLVDNNTEEPTTGSNWKLADLNNYMDLLTNQTITGVKTFTSNIAGNITGNSATATKLQTPRTITLSGDVSGSTSFDGSANVTLSAQVANDSHTHSTSTITGLGTAASRDITTSQTDTTSGRLLKVGDFGVGNSVNIGNTDLNTIVSSGFYRTQSGNPNRPTGSEFGQLIVSRGEDTLYQQISSYNGRVWQRSGNPPEVGGPGAWSPWQEIYHTGNLFTSTTAPGNAPLYACRAWVNFNGTGTVAIRASGNVSSITDNGVGDYTVNFITTMPDSNYSANVSGSDGAQGFYQGGTIVYTTTSFRFRTVSKVIGSSGDAPIYDDINYINVSIFR